MWMEYFKGNNLWHPVFKFHFNPLFGFGYDSTKICEKQHPTQRKDIKTEAADETEQEIYSKTNPHPCYRKE